MKYLQGPILARRNQELLHTLLPRGKLKASSHCVSDCKPSYKQISKSYPSVNESVNVLIMLPNVGQRMDTTMKAL